MSFETLSEGFFEGEEVVLIVEEPHPSHPSVKGVICQAPGSVPGAAGYPGKLPFERKGSK